MITLEPIYNGTFYRLKSETTGRMHDIQACLIHEMARTGVAPLYVRLTSSNLWLEEEKPKIKEALEKYYQLLLQQMSAMEQSGSSLGS